MAMIDMENWTRITAASHPKVYNAFETICHLRNECGHSAYHVPPLSSPKLRTAEQGLETLDEKDTLDFCAVSTNRSWELSHRSKEMRIAHQLLDAFRDDWE